MKVSDAINAHAQWKVRLSTYLDHPDGSLHPGEIAQDDRCELGKWIYNEAKQYSHLPEMQTLRATHAEFHRSAAEVVRKIDAGADVSHTSLTGFSSEFGALSLKIVNQLKALGSKIGLPA